MADQKDARGREPKVKLEVSPDADEREARAAAAPEDAPAEAAGAGAADAGAAAASGLRDGASRVRTWVSSTFPGHEHAFWGGVAGLLVALLYFAIGLWNTLVIAVLVLVGVAVGQVLDGDPKMINAVRRFLSRNQ